MKPGVVVDLMPPVDILGAAGRERKTTEGPKPKPVFNLQPGALLQKDGDLNPDRVQVAALGLRWKG